MATKDERKEKVEHNQEIHEKMKNTRQKSMLGDGFVKHHTDRCRG